MDDADRAQGWQSQHNADALARHRAEQTGEIMVGNGICVDCREPIEDRRLQVCPGTLRCRCCQAEHEKRQKRMS